MNPFFTALAKDGALKLVFIYGPMAVGKLTVARELARLTGFRIYHNHVSIDFVKSVFDFGTPAFWRLVDKFRREMIEEAAKEGVDTIFTFVYAKGSDDEFVCDIARRVESHGGRVCFVRLTCGRDELLRRVGSESRRGLGKLTTRSGLSRSLRKYDLTAEVPLPGSLSVDTTGRTPRQVAMEVAAHYELPVKKPRRSKKS
jgi:chloramphenicol 3-O-phosphotransferase